MSKTYKKFWLQLVVGFSMIFGLGLFQAIPAQANTDTSATDSSASGNSGFTYDIQLPENQITAEAGYFNLMMTPGQQQTLIITFSNPGTEEITVDLALNGAKTNRNGLITYDTDEIENDSSLPFIFTDIVTGPDSVTLAAGETRDVELNVQMPETSFEGLLLGGLQLKQAEDDGSEESAGGGTTVINQYAYVVAIGLQESDISGILPEMSWNRAYAGQANGRNTIFVNFSNIHGNIVNGMTVQAQITEQGASEVLYESRTTSLRMAPYSFIDYPISMNGDAMVAGMYTANVTVYVGELSWQFTEDFEITADEASQFNERDVNLTQERGLDWRLIAIVVGGLLAVVILVFLVVRQIKKNNAKKNKKSKKGNARKKDSKNKE